MFDILCNDNLSRAKEVNVSMGLKESLKDILYYIWMMQKHMYLFAILKILEHYIKHSDLNIIDFTIFGVISIFLSLHCILNK